MKFLFYFLLSGLIYYGLYLYTPEFFGYFTAVAAKTYAYIDAFVQEVMARASSGGDAAEQMLPFLSVFRRGE